MITEEQGEGIHLLEEPLLGTVGSVKLAVDVFHHVGLRPLGIKGRIGCIDGTDHGVALGIDLRAHVLQVLNVAHTAQLIGGKDDA